MTGRSSYAKKRKEQKVNREGKISVIKLEKAVRELA